MRLAGYDYAAPGAYFVTIVTQGRECLLGEVTADGTMRLSEVGETVSAEWQALPRHFARARLDVYVVMPNHLHGLIVVNQGMIDGGRGEAFASSEPFHLPPVANASPLQAHRWSGPDVDGLQGAHGTRRSSLGAMVQNFKAVSTRRLNAQRGMASAPFWQRNYYEHVVRGLADLDRIRIYIHDNPARWMADPLNSVNHEQLF